MVELSPVTDQWEREKVLSEAWFQPGLTDGDRAWLRRQFELLDVDPSGWVDIRPDPLASQQVLR